MREIISLREMSEEKQKRIEEYSQRSKFNRFFNREFVCLPKKKAEERKKIWRRKKEEKNNCRLFTQRSTDFHHNYHHETETETETERFCVFVVVKKKKTTKRNRI